MTSVRRARAEDISEARHYMRQKALGKESMTTNVDEPWSGKKWTIKETQAHAASNPAECLIVIDGFIVDVTNYLRDHVSRVISLVFPA